MVNVLLLQQHATLQRLLVVFSYFFGIDIHRHIIMAKINGRVFYYKCFYFFGANKCNKYIITASKRTKKKKKKKLEAKDCLFLFFFLLIFIDNNNNRRKRKENCWSLSATNN